MPISYVTYQSINKQRWDECIDQASNGLIYGYSFYLDAMCSHWDAMILDDYKAIMPLTYRKKYGIYYLYQPFCTASLGVFGNNITATIFNNFLQAVPNKFKYWDIYVNTKNVFTDSCFLQYQRINYVLNLQDTYSNLYHHFKESTKRNIKRCIQLNCTINTSVSIADVIALAQQQAVRFSSVTTKQYQQFTQLYQYLSSKQQAQIYGVQSATGQLLAAAVFFIDKKRAYYILVGNHPNSKVVGASHALINAFIKANAGKKLLLDFEGSDIKSLAFFYSSFGASVEQYAGIQLNNLPFFVKWFKK